MNENNERFCEFSGSSRDGPGDPGGAQKFAKNRFFAKNGVPNVLFRRFLCTMMVSALFAQFSVDFSRKFDEKSMKKTMCFFTSSLVFFNMATLTKHNIL